MGVALLLTISILAAGTGSRAVAGTKGRLAMMAARQDLRDEVCYFMADGSLSRAERHLLLEDAKKLLPHEEYVKFKESLDRISPPKSKANQLAKIKMTRKAPTLVALQDAPLPPEPLPGPVIPAGAILPERMAPTLFLR